MAVMLVLLRESTCEVHRCYGLRWDGIPSFMMIGTGVEGVLRFCLSNLKDCNVGLVWRDSRSKPLRLAQLA
jgi:hypothetical protein